MESSINTSVTASGTASVTASGTASVATSIAKATQAKAVMSRRGDDQLSMAEIGLLLAAFSTLLCSMMLNVIVH